MSSLTKNLDLPVIGGELVAYDSQEMIYAGNNRYGLTHDSRNRRVSSGIGQSGIEVGRKAEQGQDLEL